MRSKELQHNLQRIGDFCRFYGPYYVGFLLLLLLLYSSAIVARFGFHDDYYFFAYDDHSSYRFHPQFAIVLMIGRELYAVLATPMAWLIGQVADFSLVRSIFVVFLAVAALLLVRMLMRLHMEWWRAACLALAICLLPGCQLGVLWVSVVPFIGAMILSLLAAELAAAVEFDNLFGTNRRMRALACVAAAVVCLLAALFVYPPWAMFFLVPVFAYLLLETARGVKYMFTKLVIAGSIFVCSTAMYFCLQKFVFEPIYRHIFSYEGMAESAYNFAISADIGAKLDEFIEAVTESLNLWNIYPLQSVADLVAVIIVLGALASLRLLRKDLSIAEWALRAVGLLFLLPAALLPSLAATANSTVYRVMLPLAAMLTIAVYVSIGFLVDGLLLTESSRNRLRGSAAVILTLIAAGIASVNVGMSSANSALEFRLLQSLVAEHVDRGEDLDRVHIVLVPDDRSLLGLTCRYDEFNCNTLSVWQDVPWMLRAALLDLGVDQAMAGVYAIGLGSTDPIPPDARLLVTTSAPGEPYQLPLGTIVFDLNEFVKPSPATVMAHCCNFKPSGTDDGNSVAPASGAAN